MAASFLIAFTKFFTRMLLAESYFGAWTFIPVLIVATVFSAFATFAGTVYMVRKKSVGAFLTALAGAVINIGLSLLLAPSMGAMGVAVATIVSYLTVFSVRAATAKHYVRFDLSIMRITINGILICVQAFLMTTEFPEAILFNTSIQGWVLVQAAFLAFFIIYNGKPMIEGFLPVIRRRFGGRNRG